MFTDFFVEGDSLSFNGYEIVKLHKTVNLEPGLKPDVSYAVLKKKVALLSALTGFITR